MIKIFFEPKDIWIGLYWTKTYAGKDCEKVLEFYICLLPTIVIHYQPRILLEWKEYLKLSRGK